jgi:hypothetical protein
MLSQAQLSTKIHDFTERKYRKFPDLKLPFDHVYPRITHDANDFDFE